MSTPPPIPLTNPTAGETKVVVIDSGVTQYIDVDQATLLFSAAGATGATGPRGATGADGATGSGATGAT